MKRSKTTPYYNIGLFLIVQPRELSRCFYHAFHLTGTINGHRPNLKKLLSNLEVKIIIVEHKDRLVRFGIDYLESALAAQGRKLIVVDPGELRDDLVQDMIEVLTSFCARLYGRRSAKNRARKAMETIQNGS